ncbi:hypothetical protein AcV7_001856 [Taiwanofungus camphoratus]|nr:hypothetical protein AcV7_001856 [Antrodia cinnamomea]
MGRRSAPFLLFCLICSVVAQNTTNSTDHGLPYDPILQYRPTFARSMPVQILLNGIVLTLTSVLLLHLLFTAQYHWPLAPANFALQVSAVITLLITSTATLHVVLSAVTQESRTWPYMLNYVAVDIPPFGDLGWSMSELAAWMLMTATTAGIIQITHIQFLTLLYPSKLERRLIFSLLGPLAILSAVMQLLLISRKARIQSIASAVQSICNATLSLLFTTALFLWGFLVNRKQAWRTDGGTAAFGIGALILALVSTAIAFLYIPTRDQYTWMRPLLWAVILWQSFMGWWWWVGAGMGVGEVDELIRRAEKKQNKRIRRTEKRRMRRAKAETLWKEVTEVLGFGKQDVDEIDESTGQRDSSESAIHPTGSRVRGQSGTIVAPKEGFRRRPFVAPGRLVYGWFLLWRHAHLTACRKQAVERVERINQVYGRDEGIAQEVRRGTIGWGLGSFGFRRKAERFDEETVVDSESDVDADAGQAGDKSKRSKELMLEMEEGGSGVQRRNRKRARTSSDGARETRPAQERRLSSMWWWGPLQRWRLQDATAY